MKIIKELVQSIKDIKEAIISMKESIDWIKELKVVDKRFDSILWNTWSNNLISSCRWWFQNVEIKDLLDSDYFTKEILWEWQTDVVSLYVISNWSIEKVMCRKSNLPKDIIEKGNDIYYFEQ